MEWALVKSRKKKPILANDVKAMTYFYPLQTHFNLQPSQLQFFHFRILFPSIRAEDFHQFFVDPNFHPLDFFGSAQLSLFPILPWGSSYLKLHSFAWSRFHFSPARCSDNFSFLGLNRFRESATSIFGLRTFGLFCSFFNFPVLRMFTRKIRNRAFSFEYKKDAHQPIH